MRVNSVKNFIIGFKFRNYRQMYLVRTLSLAQVTVVPDFLSYVLF